MGTRKALDTLGLALADEGHVWTDEERAAYENGQKRVRWEYLSLYRYDEYDFPSDDKLNALGADGWELTGLSSAPTVMIFKRPA